MNHSCFFITEHCVHGYLHIGLQPMSTTYKITWTMASSQSNPCFFTAEYCVLGYAYIGFLPISTTYQIT